MTLSSIMMFLGSAWSFVALSYILSGNNTALTINGPISINPNFHLYMISIGLLTVGFGVLLRIRGK